VRFLDLGTGIWWINPWKSLDLAAGGLWKGTPQTLRHVAVPLHEPFTPVTAILCNIIADWHPSLKTILLVFPARLGEGLSGLESRMGWYDEVEVNSEAIRAVEGAGFVTKYFGPQGSGLGSSPWWGDVSQGYKDWGRHDEWRQRLTEEAEQMVTYCKYGELDQRTGKPIRRLERGGSLKN
jgi:hypothetical protein